MVVGQQSAIFYCSDPIEFIWNTFNPLVFFIKRSIEKGCLIPLSPFSGIAASSHPHTNSAALSHLTRRAQE